MFNSLHGRIDGGRRVSDEHNHYVNTKKRQYGDHYVECGYCKRPGHHRDFCRKLLRDDQERNAPRRRSSPLPDVEEQRVRFKHDGYDHIYGFEKREEVGGDWPYSIRGCEQRGDSVVWDRWEQIPIFPGVQSVRALVILAKAVRAGREAGVRGFVRNELLPKLIELYSRLNFECFDEAIRLFRTPTPIMTKAEFTEFVKTYGSPSVHLPSRSS